MKSKEKYKRQTTFQKEWAIKNYLNKHEIYPHNNDMQTIIINSFWVQKGGDNEMDWKIKIGFVHEHFGLFCQYANNNWQ